MSSGVRRGVLRVSWGSLRGSWAASWGLWGLSLPPRGPQETQEAPKSHPRRTNSKKLGSLALRGLPGRLIFLPQIDQNRPKIDVKQHSKIASFLKLISDGILIDLGSILSQFWITFRSMLAIILKSVEIQKTMKNHLFFMNLQGFGSWIPNVFFEFFRSPFQTSFLSFLGSIWDRFSNDLGINFREFWWPEASKINDEKGIQKYV